MALPPVPKEILKYFPKVAKGTVKATTKGWSKTTYYDVITGAPTTFLETPTVVCVAQVRAGRIPSISAPTISIPSISLPRAPTISIPSITLTSVRIARITVTERTLKYRVRERLRDWGILNWFRDRFSEAVAKVLKFVWDILIQPQIDRVRNSINSGLRTQRDRTQGALNTFRSRTQSSINSGLSDSRSKTQAALNAYRRSIQSSVNRGLSAIIPTLYSMTGLPDGQLMSPVNIRNVNKASFEFYALSRGMVLHYVAVGK